LHQVRSAAWRDAGRVLTAVESWLKTGRPGGTILKDHEAPPPALKAGETLAAALERARERVDECRSTVDRIENAPWPSAHFKHRLREQVEALCARGKPDIRPLLERDADAVWPESILRSSVLNAQLSEGARGAIGMAQAPDALALLTWLLKDQLLKRLDAEIDSLADDDTALDAEAREIRLSEAMARLLEAERLEAGLTYAALEQRLVGVEFRDINPIAILGVELIATPTIASPGTSPEHVIRVAQSR
jgi:hypothetical protein